MLLRFPIRIGLAAVLAALCTTSTFAQEEGRIDFDALLRSPEELAKLEVRHSITWWSGPLERYELVFRGSGEASLRSWSRGRPERSLAPVCSGLLPREEVEQIVARFATWRLYELDDNRKATINIGLPDTDSHALNVTYGEYAIRKRFWGEGQDRPKNLPHPALVELSNYIWEVARKASYKCRLMEGDEASETN